MDQENNNVNVDKDNVNTTVPNTTQPNVTNGEQAVTPPQVNGPQIMASNVPKVNNGNNNGKTSEKAKQVIDASKKKTKRVIVLITLAIAGFFVFKVVTSSHILDKILHNEEVVSDSKIDTGYTWADAYASYIKSYYVDLEITKMDISFVDFNEDNTPEMVLRYEDKQGKLTVKIYQINNKEVTESKNFYNSQFVMLYSSSTEKVDWYIYITSSGKYGSYTLMSKILNGTAKNADISATSEKALTAFNKNYLPSPYTINYYEVKKDKFLNDFQVIVERYKDYNKDAKDAKQKLYDDTANWQKEPGNGEVKTNFKVNEYTIPFGTYKAEVIERELGVDKKVEKFIVIKEGVMIVDGDEVRYNAYPSMVLLESGQHFEVLDNNKFEYGNNKDVYFLEE